MVVGLRVMTLAKGKFSTSSSLAKCRRRSPSVKTPANLPLLLTTLTLPDLASLIINNASRTGMVWCAIGLREPLRIMSPTRKSNARPMAPLGCRWAKSDFLKPRASSTAIESASPITSEAVVLAVGAMLNGQASFGTFTLSTTSAC